MARDDMPVGDDTGGGTHFGDGRVPEAEKADKVAEVFARVARRYDLMNDLMTWGLHRSWKRSAVRMADVKLGDRLLDLAGGRVTLPCGWPSALVRTATSSSPTSTRPSSARPSGASPDIALPTASP